METNNKPIHVIRCGSVKAVCWLNSTQAGYFYNTTFTIPYRDKSTEEWGDSTSFSDRDLLAVGHAAQEMFRWICDQKALASTQNHEDS